MHIANLKSEFKRRFGSECRIFRAPGRVNLIGEHTDYNDGFVMPVAIAFDTFVACAETDDGKLSVQSLQEPQTAQFPLRESNARPLGNWTDYVRGVVLQLERQGCTFRGANLLADGHVPIGAGLSSSAALEVASALALLDVSAGPLDRTAVAALCQRAENEFVGSRCGIMDQFASLFSRPGQALLLDCRSLEVRFISIPHGASLVICNTMVKHSIAGGEYNLRRAECESAVQYFAQHRSGVNALRDVTDNDLMQHGRGLTSTLFRRSRHVVAENARVLAAADALESGDLHAFGQLMYESHRSLQNDFEVSCRELDIMVELAADIPGNYGSRMTGGGFGGCTINMVAKEMAKQFAERITSDYQSATQIRPTVYITGAAKGAGSAGS
ncbi:MAG: galactokinase [Candidatus Sulfotelmatobacter sp.]|jgi:galactokinase